MKVSKRAYPRPLGGLIGMLLLLGSALALAPGAAASPVEALDASLARNSGIVAVRMVMAEQPRGLPMLHNAAQRGDRLAQYNLGVAYSQGKITGRSAPEAALHWYQLAARQGDARAAYNIGALYSQGAFGAADFVQARRWMHAAARMGHAGAQQWLARNAQRR